MIGAPVLECIFDTARHPKRPVYNPDPATQVGLGDRVSSAVWARDNSVDAVPHTTTYQILLNTQRRAW